MKKSLSQIAFEFSLPNEEDAVMPTPAPEKKLTVPTPPAAIYAEPETATIVEEENVGLVEDNVLQEEAIIVEKEEILDEKLSAKKIKTFKAKPTDGKPGKRGRRSLKDNAASIGMVNVPPDEELYKKQYYSIGDVAAMFSEKQSLIRFWETEFDILQPRKNRKGDRFFRPVDIKNLEMIFDLLRRRKFTIEGAKDYLKGNRSAEEKYAAIQSLEKIKGFLLEIKASL